MCVSLSRMDLSSRLLLWQQLFSSCGLVTLHQSLQQLWMLLLLCLLCRFTFTLGEEHTEINVATSGSWNSLRIRAESSFCGSTCHHNSDVHYGRTQCWVYTLMTYLSCWFELIELFSVCCPQDLGLLQNMWCRCWLGSMDSFCSSSCTCCGFYCSVFCVTPSSCSAGTPAAKVSLCQPSSSLFSSLGKRNGDVWQKNTYHITQWVGWC